MSDKNETFTYRYSSRQREEIRRIRDKYVPKEEDKMERLRRLDESASKPGAVLSVASGTVGSLLLGVGMCCTMVWENVFLLGIAVGAVGISLIAAAYPLYAWITKKRREKIAPEIIRLTDELMK